MKHHQIDCFKINMKFWKYLALWPTPKASRYYHYYSKIFLFIFIIAYNIMFTINFYFLPKKLDVFMEDMIFYFTELAISSKGLTLFFMHGNIVELFKMLECDAFQPDTAQAFRIIVEAKKFIKNYWKFISVVSLISHYTHIFSPVLMHIVFSTKLELPICNYYFISEEFKQKHIYALYIYQSLGMDIHVFYNINIDTFFLGLMVLTIAQLDILDGKLRNATDHTKNEDETVKEKVDIEREADKKIIDCIKHFDEISKFCNLIQNVFSFCTFVQFSMASSIICFCLFRFTLPAPFQYFIFLVTYMFVMVIQILIPCFFGTQIMYKSNRLSFAIYDCDWISRSRRFKSNLRLFVERVKKPLSITGGKMVLLSLTTFTSIMNSAYSFFTLLQHMKSRE